MKIIIFILFIFTLLACSPTSSEKGPKPDAPKIVEKTPDTAFVDIEKGIDATEEDSSIVIMWYQPENVTDIEKYNIYRSEDPDGDKNFKILNTDLSSSDTVYTDHNLNLETLYSYFITIVDKDGQKSMPSDTVQYKLIEKASLELPADEFVFSKPSEIVFKGHFTNGIAQSSILRIERQIGATSKELIYLQYKPNFDNYDGTVQFSLTADTLKSLFKDGFQYTWRIDLVRDLAFWGSESHTRTFRINWGG